MKLDIRQYKPSDAVEIISSRPKQPSLELTDMIVGWAEEKVKKGPAVTAVADDKIIGCGGLEIPWPGMAEGWCLFVEDIHHYTMAIAMEANRTLKRWIKEHNLIRVQAPMRADFPEGIRFAEFLGFTCEGRLRKYHPDHSDGLMYSLAAGD